MSRTPPPLKSRRSLLITGAATFFLLGAQQALYGPALPLFRGKYGIGIDQVSTVVSAQFFGAFLAVAFSGALLRRFAYRPVLIFGAGAMVVGLLMISSSPFWGGVLAGASLAGVGFGLLNVSFNLGLALAFEPRAAPPLNFVNAIFGVGAVVGPLLVAAAEPLLWPPFAALMVVALLVMALLWRLEMPPLSGERRGLKGAPWALVVGFVLLYFLYVSLEGGVAAWETEYLAPHFGAVSAASFTALFWGAMTVGRFLATPVSALMQPRRLVLTSVSLALLFAALAHFTPAAPYLYALVGLSLAPVFATSLAWLTQAFPNRAEQVTPVAVAAANLGPVLTAPIIGLTVGAAGVRAIPTALTLLALLLLVTVVYVHLLTRDPG